MSEKTFESLEELRHRLLRNESVQEMIRARAYEIYHLRGIQPGGAAQDWFQAESEVLAFLLAHHPDQVSETEGEQSVAPSTTGAPDAATPKNRKPHTTSKLTSSLTSSSTSSSKTKESAAKKAATKRSKSKKPSVSKPKSTRPRKEPESEDKTI